MITAVTGGLSAGAQLQGTKFINDFGSEALNITRTWEIAPASDGWVFFAASDALHLFNGAEWKSLSHPSGSEFRSVCISPEEERIYVGSINEFGYYTATANGTMEYTNLCENIKEAIQFGNVWGVYLNGHDLLAHCDNSVVRYDLPTGKHTNIKSGYKLDCSSLIKGVMYLGSERGLDFVVGDAIMAVPGTEILNGKRIRDILPHGDDILVVTANGGIYKYRRGETKRLDIAGEEAISAHEIFCAASRGDELALGTIDNGVYVVDTKSGQTINFNESNGLGNNTVLSLQYEGDDLWAGLQSGVRKMQLGMPVSIISNNTYPFGSGWAIATHGGNTYLGGNRGLTVYNRESGYRNIPATVGQVWNLEEVHSDLFCPHDRGLFVINGESATRVGGISNAWSVKPMKGNGGAPRAIVGTYDGLSVIQKTEGGWQTIKRIDGYYGSAYDFVLDGDATIWVHEGNQGLAKLTFNPKTLSITGRRQYKRTADRDAIGSGNYLTESDGRIMLCTDKGMYRYNKEKDAFVPHAPFNKALGDAKDIQRMRKWGNYIFTVTDNRIMRTRIRDNQSLSMPLMPAGVHKFPVEASCIFPLNDSLVAMPDKNGYTMYDFGQMPDTAHTGIPLARINEVSLTVPKDSVIYTCNIFKKAYRPEIDYANNSIRIKFGMPGISQNNPVSYQYRLNNQPWVDAGNSNVKEYTNLREGNYRFEVKVTDIDGREVTDSFEFRILPPWYRTYWAYAAYILLILAAFGAVITLERRRVIRKENVIQKEKETELARQQSDFEEETREKDRKISELEKEKLQNELEHKSQQMANALMALAGKNESIMTIKDDLKAIYQKLPATSDLRKQLLVLQSKLDTSLNSEDVLRQFEHEFNAVHYDFTKKLRTAYPLLTNNEVLMCAYIHSRLSTKEMAPLMNMSTRGVETMRYRLRKKLGLEREDSLTQFLTQFEK